MREPPAELDPAALRAALLAAYGLHAAELHFLPLGHDALAWVYRVRGVDGSDRFLKLRAGPLNEAGLRVPHLLQHRGVTAVVAPLPTVTGELWAEFGPWKLVLYPFVAGESGMVSALSEQQWVRYGATLRQVHSVDVPAELAALLRRETYLPAGAAAIQRADRALAELEALDSSGQALIELWRERRSEVFELVERAETLGRALSQRDLPLVLCHADCHVGNVIADGEQVWIVDWDEAMLAPRERDLMFMVGGIHTALLPPHGEASALRGYGPVAVDQQALAYYRYAWAVGDILAFAEELLFRPELGTASRAAAVELLAGLFAPDGIVLIAKGTPLGG